MDLTKRQSYLQRWGALKQERSSWFDHWREISDYLLPRQGRFLVTDRNRGEKRHNNILDPAGTRAHRVLSAGLMAGMTSPARPWFRLATNDDDLSQYEPVKEWLDNLGKGMRDVFARSNTYRSFQQVYGEAGGFATAATIVLPDFQDVLRHYPLTVGQYAISTDPRGNVCTLYRELSMTVSQMVMEFGLNNCSHTVKNLWEQGKQHDTWVDILHVIQPRMNRDPKMLDARNMLWESCYLEIGANRDDQFLRESGFRRFPVLAPRWETTPGDIYGSSCPGMEALGGVKQLQHEQLRKAQGIDYQTLPPLQAPTSYKGREAEMMPGGITYVDSTGPGTGIRSAWDVNIELNHLLADIQDVRHTIDQSFYVDLFLMLSNDTRSNVTAREVAERHEEKLLMLGPVLEGLHTEFLAPQIDLAFDYMLEAGIVPPPPPELNGQDLKVEFVSVLAQAQRAIGLQSIDRLLGTLGTLAAQKGDLSLYDKIDMDKTIDAYADMLGVDPDLIVANDKVAIIRQERAKQQAAMQAAQAAPVAADTAKTLSETNTQDPSALTDVMRMFSGYGS